MLRLSLLLWGLLHIACNKLPADAPLSLEASERPSFQKTQNPSPSQPTAITEAPEFERVDEDTVRIVEKKGPLIQDGVPVESGTFGVDEGSIIQYADQSFVLRNAEAIRIPKLDLSLVGSQIQFNLEVDDDLTFALLATDGETPDYLSGLCLKLKSKLKGFTAVNGEVPDACWLNKNELKASIKSEVSATQLSFRLPAATFTGLKQNFLQVIAKAKELPALKPDIVQAATVEPKAVEEKEIVKAAEPEVPAETKEETPSVADVPAPVPAEKAPAFPLEIVDIEQDEVFAVPALIPDIPESKAPEVVPDAIVEKKEEVETEVPASESPAPESPAVEIADTSESAEEIIPDLGGSAPETSEAEASESSETAIAEVEADELQKAEAASIETAAPANEAEAVLDLALKDSIQTASSRYNELKSKIEALQKERNELRTERQALRKGEMKQQKLKQRLACRGGSKNCSLEKELYAKLQNQEQNATQNIARLKDEIEILKKEADEERLVLREAKATLNKEDKVARLKAKQERDEKRRLAKEAKDEAKLKEKAAKAAERLARLQEKQKLKAEKAELKLAKEAEKEAEKAEKAQAKAQAEAEKEAEKAQAKAQAEAEKAAKAQAEAEAKAKLKSEKEAGKAQAKAEKAEKSKKID